MRLARAHIAERFEIMLSYHQCFAVLFQEQHLRARCRIAEQKRILHNLQVCRVFSGVNIFQRALRNAKATMTLASSRTV